MAIISIDKNDYYEHRHDRISTSEIIEGVAEVVVGQERKVMCKGETMIVPANTSHSFKNIGDTALIVGCGYHSNVI